MRLTVDGKEVSWSFPGSDTFHALLAELYRKVGESGRVIGRVQVDGRDLSGKAEAEMGAEPLTRISEIALTTNTPEEVLRGGIDGALSLADAIDKDILRSVEAYRQGDAVSGQSLYVACIEAMGTFFQLAGGILNGIRSGHFVVADRSKALAAAPSTETADILGRLLELQKREEWTAMADVLEYEVQPNLKAWAGFLGKLNSP